MAGFSSATLTPYEWDKRATALRRWSSFTDKAEEARYRSENKPIYRLIQEGWEAHENEATTEMEMTRTKERRGKVVRLKVVHLLQTFPIIREAHEEQCGHLGSVATKHKIDLVYSNISSREVKCFINSRSAS